MLRSPHSHLNMDLSVYIPTWHRVLLPGKDSGFLNPTGSHPVSSFSPGSEDFLCILIVLTSTSTSTTSISEEFFQNFKPQPSTIKAQWKLLEFGGFWGTQRNKLISKQQLWKGMVHEWLVKEMYASAEIELKDLDDNIWDRLWCCAVKWVQQWFNKFCSHRIGCGCSFLSTININQSGQLNLYLDVNV